MLARLVVFGVGKVCLEACPQFYLECRAGFRETSFFLRSLAIVLARPKMAPVTKSSSAVKQLLCYNNYGKIRIDYHHRFLLQISISDSVSQNLDNIRNLASYSPKTHEKHVKQVGRKLKRSLGSHQDYKGYYWPLVRTLSPVPYGLSSTSLPREQSLVLSPRNIAHARNLSRLSTGLP